MRTQLHIFIIVLVSALLSSCASTHPSPDSLQISGMKMNLSHPAAAIVDMAISKDGSLLATVDNKEGIGKVTGPGAGSLQLWDLVQGRKKMTIAINDLQYITSLALTADGKYALIGGRPINNQSSLGLWDLESGKQLKTFPELNKELACIAFSPDGKSFLVTYGTLVYLFNTKTGDFIKQFDAGSKSSFFAAPKRLEATFTPDGYYILTGDNNSVVKMWDIQSGSKVQHFAGHEKSHKGGITGISVSSDSQFILTSAAGDGSARTWDIATGKQLQKLPGRDSFWHGVWATALAADDKLAFIASQPPMLFDLATGKPVAQLQADKLISAKSGQGKQTAAVFHPNGKFLLMHNGDGAIRIFDTANGRERGMLVSFDDEEWLVITAEGYYNASEKAADYLATNLNGKDIPVERFYDSFYRPDVVMAALSGEDTRNLAPLTMSETVKAPPPNAFFATTPNDTDQATIKVCYQATDNGGGIGEIRLFHNGKLIVSDGYYRDFIKAPSEKKLQLMSMTGPAIHEQMRNLSLSDSNVLVPASSHEKGASFTDCKEIETIPGENEISLTAFNKANTLQSMSTKIRFRSTRASEPPHLYILSIGATKYKEKSVNLKYAAKDATDFQAKLSRQAATLFTPGCIHAEVFTNEKANKSNILKKFNQLSSIIKPQDSFVLFVAGHGILLQNQYYLLTSEHDGILSEAKTISSNELVDLSKKIKSLNQLYIFDSCQAGGVDAIVNSLYKARMSVLARKMGVHIYASTSSVQEAIDGYKGNGLFTYTLLEGLNNQEAADSNGDRTVSFTELGNFAKQTTINLSKKIGSSLSPLIFNPGKDSSLYKIQ